MPRPTLSAIVLAGALALAGGHVARAALPAHVPAAASDAPPRLPEPSRAAWPFPSSFPRTSGAGRLDRGASLWSDFVYDDHGAAGPQGYPTGTLQASSFLASWQGDYVYPGASAKNNGADIFRAGVGYGPRDTYWRVDWNTLADPKVPIAEWALDTDGDASTGTAQWPAGAGVSSPGVERALVVSSRGAWLIDTATGARTNVAAHGGSLTVDREAQSFVVRVPAALMAVGGRWRVRLGAGLADAAGSAFAAPSYIEPGLPALTPARLYNVTFRRVDQEPPVFRDGSTDAVANTVESALTPAPLTQLGLDGAARAVTGNFWMDDDQADTLAGGDVSRFSRTIDWSKLRARRRTAEPLPAGYSVRWYVSRFGNSLGGGMEFGEALQGATSGQLASAIPTTLSRIQPYAVYVPHDYERGRPAGLTWVLHSLEANYNQYGGLDPELMQELCERRHAICATTEGYGPAGGYAGIAETDFWQVWRSLADAYDLDPDRTVLSGYSMGGFGTNLLAPQHPDLYAAGMVLDGADTTTNVANLRWVPFVIENTFADELVPFSDAVEEAGLFDAAGFRYQLILHAGADHLIWATQDRFHDDVAALGNPLRVKRPGAFDYSWVPAGTDSRNGVGATGVYWLNDLAARDLKAPRASVSARDGALPDRAVSVVRDGPTAIAAPVPGIQHGLRWELGDRPARAQTLSLTLTNVAALTLDCAQAALRTGVLTVKTDGPTALRLRRLGRGTVVSEGGRRVARAVVLAAGTHELKVAHAAGRPAA